MNRHLITIGKQPEHFFFGGGGIKLDVTGIFTEYCKFKLLLLTSNSSRELERCTIEPLLANCDWHLITNNELDHLVSVTVGLSWLNINGYNM